MYNYMSLALFAFHGEVPRGSIPAMETITLSESAVAVLRFRIKGYRMRLDARMLADLRDLAAAGIMEPVDDHETDYRFTEEGMKHGEEILRREEVRIERERHVIPDGVVLSEAAIGLLRTRIAGQPPDGDESNRLAYRELVKANIMMPMGSFTKGDETTYRFTYAGWERRFEFGEMACAKDSA
jgi:hypothetical protein